MKALKIFGNQSIKKKTVKLWQIIFAIVIACSNGLFKANAQVISCESLKQIVAVIAADTNLTALKGGIAQEKEGNKSEMYFPQISLWQSLDDNRGALIFYDYQKHSYIFNGRIWGYLNLSKEYNATVDTFKTCLGHPWISKSTTDAQSDSTTIIKNPETFVIIVIKKNKREITIDCYYDKKHAQPVCLTGDCENYRGKLEYFNFDTYEGTFVNGIPCGKGTLTYFASGEQYNGDVLEGKPAGYGSIFNKKLKTVKDGLFFNGDTVTIDKTKRGCQFGDCENGLGLKVIINYITNEFSGIYIGHFINGHKDGIAEIIEGKRGYEKTFVGNTKNELRDGKGISFDSNGTTFASYTTGMLGKHEVELPNDTLIQYEGSFNYSKTSYFDRNNIMFRSGYNTLGVFGNKFHFSESTDAEYTKLLETVKSINEIFKYRTNNYKEITEHQNVILTKQTNEYNIKSTLKFLKTYKTNIVNAHLDSAYVLIDLTGGNIGKPDWVIQYNRYYLQLKKIFGSYWKILLDDRVASLKKKSSILMLQYIFDKTKIVKLTIDLHGVSMEIH